jgi:hypothetical protein
VHIPLNPDRYMLASLFCPNSSPLDPVSGRPDDAARATATFHLERRHRALIGRTIHHAYVVFGKKRCRPEFASVAVSVTITP